MKHHNSLSRPAMAHTKGVDPDDVLVGGLIYCLLSGDCDLDDVKDIFRIFDRFF